MKNTIDIELITKFRDKVNSNSYFVLHRYKNMNEKNQWNIICSCMDWISVAIRNLYNMKNDNNNIDVLSMQTYLYISSIDIIFEAIKQLNRVLAGNNSIPFENDNSVFKKNTPFEHMDDNTYFKHIRATFGAHPVNLNDKSGQWFASWPYKDSMNEYDFQVRLYSNKINQDDITFGIKFSELNNFLNSRYSYLNDLIEMIDNKYNTYVLEQKEQIINTDNNIVKQLEILLEEAKNRLNNDYYFYAITDLLKIFNTQLSSNNFLEKKYKEELKKVIDEIHKNLQNMEIVDLSTDNILYPDYPSSLSYEMSKLLPILSHPTYDPLFDFYLKQINNKSNEEIIIYENDSNDEIFLKVKILMYFKMWL
ncbi:hypothetical protein O8C97_08805 [Aliarcobacter butzleri]|uniref:hypothetical protein n=1 Tax=Aliarcobacter butzleri TaxID=28197 RepID=UPI00263CF600|nr:hypothetical protein [Aliarcobacter butzleri]MDN5047935.1 hypothetical protein [Aliarcobacter butzleri]